MTDENKEKIINAFNNAWSRKIASENSYGKLASKELFENKDEIKTEISTDCSYYKDVVKEEIIIDGVDVSGCEWFYKNDPCKNTCNYFCTPCEWVEIQKCMYKYAKCKEQECEELKDKIKFMEEYIKAVENARDELGKENAEIRKYQYEQDFLLQQLDKVIKENKEMKTCYKNNLALLDKEEVNTTKLVNKVMKLEKKLSEIKVFVMQAKHDYNLPKYLFDTILQKISEVENEN